MAGAIEEGAKVALSFTDALKREPLSLALVVMNLCLLLFFYVILTRVADQRKEEIGLLYQDKREMRELLAKCVVPERDRRGEQWPLPLPYGVDPQKPGHVEDAPKPNPTL